MIQETITTYNGNKQKVVKGLPTIIIIGKCNDVALEHLKDNTQLNFKPYGLSGYMAQPDTSKQIVKLFLTYNFKTCYFDNGDYKNTLMLKWRDHGDWD